MSPSKNDTHYYEHEEEFNPVKFLKSLSLDDFLNCKETNDILNSEHYWKFEETLSEQLEHLYKNYYLQFPDNPVIFGRNYNALNANSFADLIYEFIDKKYDLTIFYDNPHLAEPLFKLHNK